MYRLLDRTGELLARASLVLGVAAALVMVASLLLGVFYRYVLQSSLAWSGELALLAFAWTVFLIASAMVRGGEHVRVSFVLDRLPRPLDEILERLILALVLAFGLIMLWTGWQFAAFTAGQVSPAIRYPVWWLNAAVPVSGALIAVHALVLLVAPQRLAGRESGGCDE